jgi:hypothetical protein
MRPVFRHLLRLDAVNPNSLWLGLKRDPLITFAAIALAVALSAILITILIRGR